MTKLRLLDLFSGIGGFSLGLERSGGFETAAFCEIEPFCRKVLAKHWPHVKQYDDVRTLTAERLAADGIAVDAICGGFPCQDISFAGAGAGIEGKRSGLWTEYARLIGELRPAVIFVENVAALLSRGLDKVLGDLAAVGYDAEWHCIPASAVGAPHRRDRIWLVAHSKHHGSHGAAIAGRFRESEKGWRLFQSERLDALGFVANANCARRTNIQGRSQAKRLNGCGAFGGCGFGHGASHDWSAEPDVGRVANGVPSRVDRLRALGNAVVPQIPELLGRAYLASLEAA